MTNNDGRLQQHIVPASSVRTSVAPRAVLDGGKVLLVEDALSLYRPRTASSTNQVGYQCLLLEQYLGHSSIEELEREIMQFAHLHHARSVWYRENYQHPIRQSLPSVLSYWAKAVADCWRSKFDWGSTKLRR
jgi:hypothetical protein